MAEFLNYQIIKLSNYQIEKVSPKFAATIVIGDVEFYHQ
jgi:hypothetical protein